MRKLVNIMCFMYVTMFFVLLFFCFVGCGGTKNSANKNNVTKINKLNIVTNNTAFVKNSNNLSQIADISVLKSLSKQYSVLKSETGTAGVSDVTTDSGESVTVENVIPINLSYSLIQNLTVEGEESSELNYILNISTGDLVLLDIFPDNIKNIAIDGNLIYFIAEGQLYEMNVSTATYGIVSPSCKYYEATTFSEQPFLSNSLVFLDEARYLYILKVDFTSGGTWGKHGIFERYLKNEGVWQRDADWIATDLTSIYYDEFNSQSSLTSGSWIFQNEDTLKIYRAEFRTFATGDYINVYEVDIATFSEGASPIAHLDIELYTKSVSETVVTTTYLGYNKTLKQCAITDSKTIFTFKFDGSGNLEINHVDSSAVPVVYYDTANDKGVINQKYMNNEVIVKDGTSVISWDLSLPYGLNSSEITDGDNIEFL